MAHQAEAEQLLLDEEKRLYRERQKHYKEDLDRQHSDVISRRKNKLDPNRQELNSISGLDSERREREILERKKAATMELKREMQEREQYVSAERTRELMEKSDYQLFLNRLEENDQRMQAYNKERKLQLANNLRQSYNQQEIGKKQLSVMEKYNDARLLEQQQKQWPVIDFEKKKVKKIFNFQVAL